MSQVSLPRATAALAAATSLVALTSHRAEAAGVPGTFADQVISYDGGTNRFQFNLYTNPAVALGSPQTSTGGGFVVTPFNNPFSRNDVVSVGLGGQITLRLARFAEPVAGATPEIGVFTFQQFLQTATGGTNSGPTLFYPSLLAKAEVSADGLAWVALNGGNPVAFDIPANAYGDAPPTILSDYGQPFVGGLDALRDRASLADTIAAYNGSGGGTWLDISGTGLPHVGYVRFIVPASNTFSFQLEAISVSSASAGALVPEPALAFAAAVAVAVASTVCRRRR
jgi:hypothetical protein